MKKKIRVIGCGVTGLTTAVRLLEDGYDVSIITESLPPETTSAKAAAIWFPYEIKPKDKANQWSEFSFNQFEYLSTIPQSGVSMTSLIVLVEKEEDTWWKDALPKDQVKEIEVTNITIDYSTAYQVKVPLIETQIYLAYLFNQFKKLKGKLIQRKVEDLSELLDTHTVTINCTGLGARELAGDQELYAIKGQIVKIDKIAGVDCISAEFHFDGDSEKLGYIIPRSDCIVLGGTAILNDENLIPSEVLTQEIIERCGRLAANLENTNIQSIEVGLRPGRASVRLMKEHDQLIHNYGHGGAGFTVSWGCAEEVLKIVQTID